LGLTAYGALRETHNLGIWNIENIQSIYGTSIGAILGIILALKYDWTTIDDYLIKRPWHTVLKYDIHTIFGAFEKRGIFDITVVEELFSPLFRGMDIPMTITMREFYERTNIDIHVISTDINAFEIVDISHKTHPEWRLVDAAYASACLPIFFSPFIKEDKYYIDGGIFLNYPLEHCVQSGKCDPAEILGLCKRDQHGNEDSGIMTRESNLMDYILILLKKTLKALSKENVILSEKNEIIINGPDVVSVSDLFNMASSKERRKQWIEDGFKLARQKYCGEDVILGPPIDSISEGENGDDATLSLPLPLPH